MNGIVKRGRNIKKIVVKAMLNWALDCSEINCFIQQPSRCHYVHDARQVPIQHFHTTYEIVLHGFYGELMKT